ncbi:ion channel protein [Nonomuraea sp. NPDC050310]|uniref:ion channel protein n=1 Tax=Nonomuraea sp. NPDC050310 TaxID=3154935 RepID=UPI0033F39A77
MATPPIAHSRAGTLARMALPAVVVGVGCALTLLGLSYLAELLQHVLWDRLPSWIGFTGSAWWWILAVLTLSGVAVGLALWKLPSGPDPATEALVGPPLPVKVLPGILLAAVFTLAGGASLGPENPITAATIAVTVAAGARLIPAVPGVAWMGMAVAGTVGAMFGTPVAAALLLSETNAGADAPPLWDRLFAPLVAAAAGAITMVVIASPSFALDLPDYAMRPIDLLSGMVIATIGAAVGLVAVYAFPHVHRLFHRVRQPVARLALGGFVLGVLGVIGGMITLFKGLAEMRELIGAGYPAGHLLLVVVVKVAALLVAATAGFVGGRIFPAVFVGVALGLLVCEVVPGVPVPLAVACGVLGLTLAVTQQGWLSLFMAVTVVTDLDLVPLLCLALLPSWLLVTGRPQMLIEERP